MINVTKSFRYGGFLWVLFLVLSFCQAVQAGQWFLSDEQWARPRAGILLVQMPPVRAVVNRWMQTGSGTIVIRYPGADEGEVWAGELRDWLVALGIPSRYLLLESGLGRDDALALEYVPEPG